MSGYMRNSGRPAPKTAGSKGKELQLPALGHQVPLVDMLEKLAEGLLLTARVYRVEAHEDPLPDMTSSWRKSPCGRPGST